MGCMGLLPLWRDVAKKKQYRISYLFLAANCKTDLMKRRVVVEEGRVSHQRE